MKIVQVCPRFFPDIGGVETHVYEISKRLAKDNEVCVYTTDPTGKLPKEEVLDGIRVLRFKSFAPNDAYFFSPQLYFALKKESCDVLHVHSFHALPSFMAYCATKNFKKLIFTPHYHPRASTRFRGVMHKLYDSLQSRLFRKADKVICVSDYERDLISKKFGVPRLKIANIPNGIDVERFMELPECRKDGFHILYVGRLEKYKRVQWILESLKDLIKKYPDRKVSLTIVGKGNFERDLKNIAGSLGLQEFVTFKHDLSNGEMLNEYSKCDVFVMPSEYEAFSISTLEALSCGRPVIVSNVGFLSEISRGNGFTIDSRSDLTNRLSYIIENGMKVDFDFRKYSWDGVADQTLMVYGE
jgi:glycosyltransferase involved in cell wall biosynthesis